MKIVHEAIINDYHFIVSPDYLVITKDNEELVHLDSKQAEEITTWLWEETKRNPIAVPVSNEKIQYDAVKNYVGKAAYEKTYTAIPYEPGDRSAVQTHNSLPGEGLPPAENEIPAFVGGRQRIQAVETVDLGRIRASGVI